MCRDEREWDHCLKNAPAGSKSITTLMVSLTTDNYRSNRLQVNHAVRLNAIRRYMWLSERQRESGYGYQFQCRCICGQLVYIAVCEPYFSKFVYLWLCLCVWCRTQKKGTSQAVVYCNHTSNHDPREAWHQASAVFAVAGGVGGGGVGR